MHEELSQTATDGLSDKDRLVNARGNKAGKETFPGKAMKALTEDGEVELERLSGQDGNALTSQQRTRWKEKDGI